MNKARKPENKLEYARTGKAGKYGNEVRTPRLLIILDVSVEITYAIRNAICL